MEKSYDYIDFLLGAGDAWFEGDRIVGKAEDGEIVDLGQYDEKTNDYLFNHPHPSMW